MAIAFDKIVGQTTVTASNANVVVTVAAGGVAAGELCIAVAYADINIGWSSAVDSRGNTWTLVESLGNVANGDVPFCSGTFYSIIATALQAGDTITFTSGSASFGDRGASCMAYSGISAIDGHVSGQDNVSPATSQLDSGGFNNTQADAIFIGFCTADGLRTFTATSLWTPRTTFNITGAGNQGTIYIEDRIVSSLTNDGTSPLASTNIYWNAQCAIFKAGVGTPPSPVGTYRVSVGGRGGASWG